MTNKDDEYYLNEYMMIRCRNCKCFSLSGYCNSPKEIKGYRPPTPDKYHRCKNYKGEGQEKLEEKPKVTLSETAERYIKEIKDKLK